jgi:hypothetical protein
MNFERYNESYLYLLEKYFAHPDTPENNASHKALKTHLYDGKQGMMGIMIHDDEIVAMSSALVIEERGIISIKYPHRIHVRSDYKHLSNTIMNKHWEPMLFEWLKQQKHEHLYCTFNAHADRSFWWSAVKHQRRIKNDYVDDFGQAVIARKWYIHHAMVEEMHCYQHVMFTSPDDRWFYPWRPSRPMPYHLHSQLDMRFSFVEGSGWQL